MSNQIDPVQIATQYIQFDRARGDQSLQRRQREVDAMDRALETLEDRLKDIQRVAEPFTERGNVIGFEVSSSDANNQFLSASINRDTLASGENTPSGRYSFRVNQLAREHQVAVDFSELQSNVGELEIRMPEQISKSGQKGVSFNIPVNAQTSLQDVVTAINKQVDSQFNDGQGLRATILRNGGEEYLVLTSETTGVSSVIEMSMTRNDDNAATLSSSRVLQQGQDAIVQLGEGANAIKLTSASNRLEETISGVTLELTQTHEPTDPPTRITMGRTSAAVEESLNTLIDEVNALSSSINDNSNLSRDVGARSIRNQIRSVFREISVGQGSDTHSLRDMGISLNAEGNLQVDSERLSDFLENHPEQVDTLLQGEDGLFNRLQARTEVFLKRNSGVIDSRQASLEEQRGRIEAARERHDRDMDKRFNRYLREFAQIQASMAQFEQTFGAI